MKCMYNHRFLPPHCRPPRSTGEKWVSNKVDQTRGFADSEAIFSDADALDKDHLSVNIQGT
jgi:hypothetical protein